MDYRLLQDTSIADWVGEKLHNVLDRLNKNSGTHGNR